MVLENGRVHSIETNADTMLAARYRALAFEPVLAMTTVVRGVGSDRFFHVRSEELFAWAIETLGRVLGRMNTVSVVAVDLPNLLRHLIMAAAILHPFGFEITHVDSRRVNKVI